MTRRIVIGKDFEVACWVANLAGGAWVPGQCTAIGLAELNAEGEGELIAGVVYDSFNGASVCMHVAAVPGARWMTKDYLRICFAYPFQQLKVNKIRSMNTWALFLRRPSRMLTPMATCCSTR